MFNFPFYGYRYNYPYYKYYDKHINNYSNFNNKENVDTKNSITNSQKISNTINHKFNDSEAIFEMFGIKLYTDDLIIISLLFVLYNQNVNDEILYIVLFLLLFS